jgi:hypothetical protein
VFKIGWFCQKISAAIPLLAKVKTDPKTCDEDHQKTAILQASLTLTAKEPG